MSGIDEQQLIELIEGELRGAEAEKLRAQLIRKDAAWAARVVAMQHDRQARRSLPPVDPPIDFLAELEPMIARPMLMENVPGAASASVIITKPGAARRAVHREHRRAQLAPAAVAAAIVLVLSAGLWYTLSQVDVFNSEPSFAQNTGDPDDTLRTSAANSALNDVSDNIGAAQAENNSLLASGRLHHKLPSLNDLPSVGQQPTLVAAANVQPDLKGTDPSHFVLAHFELVIQTTRGDDPQNVLARAIEPLAGRAAVVRNLTAANLKQIESAWLTSRAETRGAIEPLRAGVNDTNASTGLNPAGSRSQPVLNAEMLRDSADKLIESGLVAGEPALMPQYSTQIELSEAGSVYTIVLPAMQLQVMLERLAAARGFEAAQLVMRDATVDENADLQPLARWIIDLSRVQHSWEQLAREHPDAMVVLPIIVGK